MHPAAHLTKLVLAVAIPVLITVAIYWPGLAGPFLLDDMHNLRPLAQVGQDDGWGGVARFLFTGASGPTGRPVSLMTFLLDDVHWPSDPRSFKHTNLMIHLLNGMLLMLFALTLLRQSVLASRIVLPAAALTLLWLVHPLNVSTVLYVIQRMTELSALFTLIGILVYLHGRRLLNSRPVAAYWWMSVSIVGCGGLSILSKESGVLLLVYVCVLELTLLEAWYERRPRTWHRWATVFLYVPLFCTGAYILWRAPGAYGTRDFTLVERLLTETRVLRDYLAQIFVPRLGGGGLYHDDYVISRGLLSPWDTLVSVLFVLTLLGFGAWCRRRYPLLAFAVLWFFGGHVLESTVVSLEIYFEHRNYLPMVGPLFALTKWVFASTHRRRVRYVANLGFGLVLVGSTTITALDTPVWGSARKITDVWAFEHPHSVRARQTIASYWGVRGNYGPALDAVQSELRAKPRNSALLLEVMYLKCMQGEVDAHTVASVTRELVTARHLKALFAHLSDLLRFVENDGCKGLDSNNLRQIVQVLLENPDFHHVEALYQLEQVSATLHVHDRFLDGAVQALDRAHGHIETVDTPLVQAYQLSTAGLYDDALQYVDIAEQVSSRLGNPFAREIRNGDVERMRELIKAAKEKSEM